MLTQKSCPSDKNISIQSSPRSCCWQKQSFREKSANWKQTNKNLCFLNVLWYLSFLHSISMNSLWRLHHHKLAWVPCFRSQSNLVCLFYSCISNWSFPDGSWLVVFQISQVLEIQLDQRRSSHEISILIFFWNGMFSFIPHLFSCFYLLFHHERI